MTEIKLHTYGEKLIVSEKVTLAAGNINSAELHVTLDDAWAAYSNFSATFETKEYIEPVEKLMVAKTATEYVCVIPSEVLQHQGVLEIGIRGVSNNGEMAKTSSIAKYNIVKGASPGNITLNPTMDLYQQYLAAMDEKTAPLFNDYKAALDDEFLTITTALENSYKTFQNHLLATVSRTLLWTNNKTSAEFAAQTINLDLKDYVRFIVTFKHDTKSDLFHECSISRKDRTYIERMYIEPTDYSRQITITDTGITFTGCSTDSSTSTPNENLIPCRIYGYKY